MKSFLCATLLCAGVLAAENTIKNRLGQMQMRNLAENIQQTPSPPVSQHSLIPSLSVKESSRYLSYPS